MVVAVQLTHARDDFGKAGPTCFAPLIVPKPKPSANEVLVQVRACAVCRTDLHVVDGELPNPKLPLVPGHEIVGTIVEKGRGARAFQNWRPRGHSVAGLDLR